ncbi:MAG: NifU family protein [Bacteroidota bacterium]
MGRVFDIHAVKSPNMLAMKFELPSLLLTKGAYTFSSREEAQEQSPLATKLFGFDYVESVFIAKNFVTVTKKAEEPTWDEIMIDIRIVIKKHLEDGEALFNFDADAFAHSEPLEGKAGKIQDLIKRHIQPATWSDGGEINFDSYADGKVKVKLAGACITCPFAPRTLKHGVQVILDRAFPDEKLEVTSDDIDWTKTQAQ